MFSFLPAQWPASAAVCTEVGKEDTLMPLKGTDQLGGGGDSSAYRMMKDSSQAIWSTHN